MNSQQIEKRNLLSSFFVTLLIALAYQEMILAVKDLSRKDGISIDTLLLPAIFFFVSVRFFVGNQFHLLGNTLLTMPGMVWLYDLMVIITQCLVLVLLGGLTSIESNIASKITFLDLTILLYVIDVVWIISQSIIGKVFRRWRRPFIPWAWAILNALLVCLFYILDILLSHDIYNRNGLLCLLGLNVFGFIVDVVLVDYYDVI